MKKWVDWNTWFPVNDVQLDEIKATKDDGIPTGTIPEPEINFTGNAGAVDANSKVSEEHSVNLKARM